MNHLYQYALWSAGPLAQAAVVVLMWRRGLRREFPVFFSYNIFSIVSTVALMAFFDLSYASYFRAYWTSAGLSMLFGLAVIYEIFVYSFRPYETLLDFGRVLFRWAAAVVLLVAVVMAVGSHGNGMNMLLYAIITMDRSVRVMQCGLVLLLLFTATHLGLSWRSRIFGIALGFGTYAAVELIAFTLRATVGYSASVNTMVNLVVRSSYIGVTLMWGAYMLAPEPARRALTYLPQSAQWNFALGGVARSTTGPLFLTNVESTVERIMGQRDGENGGASLRP